MPANNRRLLHGGISNSHYIINTHKQLYFYLHRNVPQKIEVGGRDVARRREERERDEGENTWLVQYKILEGP